MRNKVTKIPGVPMYTTEYLKHSLEVEKDRREGKHIKMNNEEEETITEQIEFFRDGKIISADFEKLLNSDSADIDDEKWACYRDRLNLGKYRKPIKK